VLQCKFVELAYGETGTPYLNGVPRTASGETERRTVEATVRQDWESYIEASPNWTYSKWWRMCGGNWVYSIDPPLS